MLLRIAIVDDLPQDAERLQQALTAEGQNEHHPLRKRRRTA